MVAVRNHEADRYLSHPPSGVVVFLVHGPDSGLVSERSDLIIRNFVDDRHDPFQMVLLSGDEIADNPAILLDEANTLGLFDSNRVIHISTGRKQITGPLSSLLEDPPENCTVLISSAALKKDAPLRKLCSRSKNAAVIDCYPDNERDVERLIDDYAREFGTKISVEAKKLLAALLGADRKSTRSEIEKLFLYAQKSREISIQHVEDIIVGASNKSFDDVVDAAFLGSTDAATELLERLILTGDAGVLIGACIRRCTLLHQIHSQSGPNGNLTQAVESLAGRHLFGPRKQNLIVQLKSWNLKKTIIVLRRLEKMALSIRLASTMSNLIAMRAIWMIGHTARN